MSDFDDVRVMVVNPMPQIDALRFAVAAFSYADTNLATPEFFQSAAQTNRIAAQWWRMFCSNRVLFSMAELASELEDDEKQDLLSAIAMAYTSHCLNNGLSESIPFIWNDDGTADAVPF